MSMRGARRRWLPQWALVVPLAALVVLGASCGVPGAQDSPGVATGVGQAAGPVRLQFASTEYYTGGPGDPVVELRVILNNTGQRHTDSTTIRWEPAFAQDFTFLRSEPAAWRVRVDEMGWGVVDTSGVLPEQFGTFRIWFAMNTYTPHEPRVAVVVNGSAEIAMTTARATHLKWQADIPKQRVFERGLPALTADVFGFVPADGRGAFWLALWMGLSLIGMAGGGGLVAFWLAPRAR
jgi:hypothetical protein